MLYDLNLMWHPSTSASELDNLLRFSAALGYDVVALNHVITGPIPSTPHNPLPPKPSTPSSPTVLHRATVVLSDPNLNFRLASLTPLYDVLAVRPTTAPSFQAACLTRAEPALISLDLAARLPFPLRHRPIAAAIDRGVRFELSYAPALAAADGAGPADPRARAAVHANAAALVRATRGRGIVVTSGAARALELRAPADVGNLLAVWRLGPERGGEALGALPRDVLANEAMRRGGYRGVVSVVRTVPRPVVLAEHRKRKSVELESGVDESAKAGAPGLSKRQAKKQRLAAAAAKNVPA